MKKPLAIGYARDFSTTRSLPPQDKFAELLQMLEDTKAKDDNDPERPTVLMVDNPMVLGDDYDELVCNLCFIAQARLMVAITDTGASEVLERGERYPPSG